MYFVLIVLAASFLVTYLTTPVLIRKFTRSNFVGPDMSKLNKRALNMSRQNKRDMSKQNKRDMNTSRKEKRDMNMKRENMKERENMQERAKKLVRELPKTESTMKSEKEFG